jgi:hypothetical protein
MKADNPGVGLGRVGVVLGVVLAAAGAAAPGNGAQRAEPAAILYSTPGNSEDEACGALWSIDPEGGVPRPLDVGLGVSCDPDWSPNARQIAFSGKQVSDNFRIYVADETGANAAPVSHPPSGSDDFMPAWSPDGTRIAFERRPPSRDRYNLFIVDARGHERAAADARSRIRRHAVVVAGRAHPVRQRPHASAPGVQGLFRALRVAPQRRPRRSHHAEPLQCIDACLVAGRHAHRLGAGAVDRRSAPPLRHEFRHDRFATARFGRGVAGVVA